MTERRVKYSDSRRRSGRQRRRRLAGLVAVLLVALLVAFAAARLLGRTSSGPASDPTKIVKAAAEAMGAEGFTMRTAAAASFVARVSGGDKEGAMEFNGEVVVPGKMRVTGTLALPDLPRTAFEMVTVDGGATAYMKVAAVAGGWQKLPAEATPADTDPRADLLRSLAAATQVKLTRSAKVDGHECDVIELRLDIAALEKSDPNLDLASSLADNLGMSADEIVAALGKAVGKRMLWIGKDDHLVYKDQMTVKVDGGTRGTYEESETGTFSAFGKPLSTPIVAPVLGGNP